MANRPSTDKAPAPRSTARKSRSSRPAQESAPPKSATSKRAAPRSSASTAKHASAQPEAPRSAQSAPVDGAAVLKEGVSKLFGRGRELLSEKGPGLLNTLERATVVAIDQTAKGLTAFEKGANDLEAKVGKGLKDLLDRRRAPSDSPRSKGPKA